MFRDVVYEFIPFFSYKLYNSTYLLSTALERNDKELINGENTEKYENFQEGNVVKRMRELKYSDFMC